MLEDLARGAAQHEFVRYAGAPLDHEVVHGHCVVAERNQKRRDRQNDAAFGQLRVAGLESHALQTAILDRSLMQCPQCVQPRVDVSQGRGERGIDFGRRQTDPDVIEPAAQADEDRGEGARRAREQGRAAVQAGLPLHVQKTGFAEGHRNLVLSDVTALLEHLVPQGAAIIDQTVIGGLARAQNFLERAALGRVHG